MATRVIDDVKLQNIAVAIQTKDNGGQMTVDEMPGRIQAMTIMQPILPPKNINFYDYDGTILYAYTQPEFLALSDMPTLPRQNGLICQCWNWGHQDAVDYITEYGILDVGAIYITDNGESRFYMEFPSRARLSPTFKCQVKGGSVYVDWGDNSTPDILTNTGTSYADRSISHVYTNSGNYVIRVSCDDNAKYQFSSAIFDDIGFIALVKVNIGRNVEVIGNNSFANAFALKSITIPNGVPILAAFLNCFSLTHISIPNSSDDSTPYFMNGWALKTVSMPKSIKRILTQAFDGCYLIRSMVIPDSVSSIGDYAFKLRILSEIVVPKSVVRFNLSFTSSRGLKYFDLSHYDDPNNIPVLTDARILNDTRSDLTILFKNQTMLDAFAAATNWSTLSSKFVVKGATA